MRGSIIPRGNSYRICVSLGRDPVTGKHKQYWETATSRKRAEKRLTEILHELDKGTFVEPQRIRLADYLRTWLERAKPNLSPRTFEGYETIINRHLLPKLGGVMVGALRVDHLQDYYTELLKSGRCDGSGGLSPQTVTHHHTLLHKVLEDAIESGIVGRNVCDIATPPPARSPEMQSWDSAGASRFIEAVRASQYYPLFLLVLYTGMRRSEILAIRWQDLDLKTGQVSVSRGLHQLHDNSFAYRAPKSKKGKRTIALSPTAVKALREHRERQEEMRLKLDLPAPENGDLVFSHYDGSPLRPATVSRAWDIAVKKAGVKPIRLHDARHTHASILLALGVHPKVVQERLGHATIAITLDTYSHITPGMQEQAAKAFDRALGSNGGD